MLSPSSGLRKWIKLNPARRILRRAGLTLRKQQIPLCAPAHKKVHGNSTDKSIVHLQFSFNFGFLSGKCFKHTMRNPLCQILISINS